MSVLLIGAVGFSIGVALLWFGVGAGKTSLAAQNSGQALGLANACAEEALEQIRENTAFGGAGNLVLGAGTCTYNVAKLLGQNRQITAVGTVGTVVRKASISVSAINPAMVVSSWQEVP